MGVPDRSLVDLIDKVKSWINWVPTDWNFISTESNMSGNNSSEVCYECEMKFADTCLAYHCRSCGRVFCGNCTRKLSCFHSGLTEIKSTADTESYIKFCKVCLKTSSAHGEWKNCDKVYPSESPLQSSEPSSPNFSGQRMSVYSSHAESRYSVAPLSGHPSPISVHRSPSRSDEEEGDHSSRSFFSLSSDYCNDGSDVDSSSLSLRREFFSFKSVGSSSFDSPSRIHISSTRGGNSEQQEQWGTTKSQTGADIMSVIKKPETEDVEHTNECNDHVPMFSECETFQKPLEFDNNNLIWLPPPPEDEFVELESNLFAFDDEDDEIGDSGVFSSSSSLANMYPKKRMIDGPKEPLRTVVQGHFWALVSQLLQGEGIKVGKDCKDDWLDIVAHLAWQAGNFVRPDTSRGGSMDPVDYVKVKCIASGSPKESTLVKGIVCTKNIKHKRMTSQYKNPRILILGGALEYQRVPNQLSSFTTLLEQEINNLKLIVSKIEARRPNVLLVEKSVASYAQEYLLAKEISLVLNVKRPLLERIARCTGASITPTIDNLSAARLGNCELFRLEKVSEDLESVNHLTKRPMKTLMFFEGCPRRLGCTVLLKGSSREELKKIKHVVQYAVFAAYHLSLETSFLADEGASIPRISIRPSLAIPDTMNPDNAISIIPDTPTVDSQTTIREDVDWKLQNEENKIPVEHVNFHHSPSIEIYGDDLACNAVWDDVGNSTKQENFKLDGEDDRGSHDCEPRTVNENEASEYYSAADSHQSILVSFSSRCILTGTVCERSRLIRIKFYGNFDKPLGRYLRDDLFDQISGCRTCKEPAEAHVLCYTHQQGNLTINVRSLLSVKLPGERDGKIWMWHRCLKCAYIDGIPPATRRVIMSDAAWGLSFGKFLELSFSNHATANRVASCGHSLQKDCLRFYGFGGMIAFFRYSPIDILSVHLPPSVLEFKSQFQQEWLRKEADELMAKMENLYSQYYTFIDGMEQKCSFCYQISDRDRLLDQILDFKDELVQEREDYEDFLQSSGDILELNCLRRSLILNAQICGHKLSSLDFLLKTKIANMDSGHELKELKGFSSKDCSRNPFPEGDTNIHKLLTRDNDVHVQQKEDSFVSTEEPHKPNLERDVGVQLTSTECVKSGESKLSETIDLAWTGGGPKPQNLSVQRIASPTRVYSFDSALSLQDRVRKRSPPSSLYLSTFRSFNASRDCQNMQRTYSQDSQKLNLMPFVISSMSFMPKGGHLFSQTGCRDFVVVVYDNEPTSIISYALSSREYDDWISGRSNKDSDTGKMSQENSMVSSFLVWQSFVDLDQIHNGNYGSESVSSAFSSLFSSPKSSPHPKLSFGDDKVKFSVTCYFAKQFDELRKKCCPSDVDFVRSLSRCKRWSAQGGKSNVFFAKSLDQRFIIKEVQKTELESFEEFAPEYFRYLTDSLNSGSPTCLAKILGIYKVSVMNLKGGKEVKMDLMVMENLFFMRNISRIYDLKGSARSRYNTDATGTNCVLLDMNLIETLRTNPIFLGSKAKRSLERAVWNDTSFLASVDVMDYSLLVGVDEDRKELVLGIIDFMRQYTWDKHLETWVKASGILGGSKNASPTIVSPKQYKKRFRKAMTTYFMTVPDQWLS